jgi:hypothetical protein
MISNVPSSPSLGSFATGRPLYIQCSYPGQRQIKIVTAREPLLTEWINY